jgi:hypothetical protein
VPSLDTIELLTEACRLLRVEDQQHFEGGCGDISAAICRYLQALPVKIERQAGTAFLDDQHTHVWLLVEGRIFDPIAAGTGWNYREYKAATTPEEVQWILDLHTDDQLLEFWDDSYEKSLMETIDARMNLTEKLRALLLEPVMRPLPSMVYLTNAAFDVLPEGLAALKEAGLPLHAGARGESPFTALEMAIFREEVEIDGELFLGNYSILLDGQRYYAPHREIFFDDDGIDLDGYTRADALKVAREVEARFQPKAQALGGKAVLIMDDGPDGDRHTVILLLPIEKAESFHNYLAFHI